MAADIIIPEITASKIIVGGRRPLGGEIMLQGSKNAALPMLVASIINKGTTTLYNCPDITDVDDILKLLEATGCKIAREGNTVMVDASYITSYEIPKEAAKRTRGSFVMLGALMARGKHAKVPYPGGCPIGARPVDIHLKALMQMGMEPAGTAEDIADVVFHRKSNVRIRLSYPSVGATENCIFAAVIGEGKVVLHNCAKEPEITELCNMLLSMGADIKGIGSSTLRINGVPGLHDTEWIVAGDRIAAGTYMTAAVISGGSVTVRGIRPEHVMTELMLLSDAGAAVTVWDNVIHIRKHYTDGRIRPIRKIVTRPYPGFATDMQSQMMSMLAYADGSSRITEKIFESRFKTADELTKMGADIKICGRTACIKGKKSLYGASLEAGDLRGGAALVLAALGAEGTSEITGCNHIKRGYENFVGVLKELGADIKESV